MAVAAAATGVLANEGASLHPYKVLLPMFGGSLSAWSPDSRQIAVPESKAITLRGIDGRVQRRLRGPGIGYSGLPPCSECSLDWTDDGARIQFVSHENEVEADAVVGSIAVDGGDEQRRSLEVSISAIAWAPTGWPLIYIPSSRIVGLKGRQVGNPDLWRLDSLYGEPRKLIESRVSEFDPLFSPDGTEIAFMRERESSSSLWKVSAEGANPQQLTGNLFGPSSASWSPDGRRIALSTYSRKRDNRGYRLYVLPADGGPLRQIVKEEIFPNRPAWTPDGRWITFSTYDGEIRNVRPNGTGLQTIARLPGKEVQGLSWSPNGKYLGYTARVPKFD
jgi:Tol biopolymer transport system component